MVGKTEVYEISGFEGSAVKKAKSVKAAKSIKAIPEIEEEIVDKNAPLVKPTFWVRREEHEWKHSIKGVKSRAIVDIGRTLGANYFRYHSG